MKRTASRRGSPAFPIFGNQAENVVLRAYAADSFDDRVSEDFFDVEDEHAEVAIIVQHLSRELH